MVEAGCFGVMFDGKEWVMGLGWNLEEGSTEREEGVAVLAGGGVECISLLASTSVSRLAPNWDELHRQRQRHITLSTSRIPLTASDRQSPISAPRKPAALLLPRRRQTQPLFSSAA
ncbi:hypothetical protein MRB53_002435 [Persea americana]|uniref:Uncharacterized protein n=1 Tax=Persea americana TaxID=3435 RepID=A0ACC2MWW3_PERAE|nr:hypothetical protein MRB53_002435 [Persea americana]